MDLVIGIVGGCLTVMGAVALTVEYSGQAPPDRRACIVLFCGTVLMAVALAVNQARWEFATVPASESITAEVPAP